MGPSGSCRPSHPGSQCRPPDSTGLHSRSGRDRWDRYEPWTGLDRARRSLSRDTTVARAPSPVRGSVEDHGLVAEDEDPSLEVPSYGAGEHDLLEVASFADEVVDGVLV